MKDQKNGENPETQKSQVAGILPILGMALFMGTLLVMIVTSKNL
jgi:uncharacterized membrane protein YgdD (TMEM256/DUF423 family)